MAAEGRANARCTMNPSPRGADFSLRGTSVPPFLQVSIRTPSASTIHFTAPKSSSFPILAKDATEAVGNLADGDIDFGRGEDRWHQVVAAEGRRFDRLQPA